MNSDASFQEPVIRSSEPIVLTISGIGSPMSFKNNKKIVGIVPIKGRKAEWKGQPMLATEKRVRRWMNAAMLGFVSQLRSLFPTTSSATTTACSARFWIASFPQDDSWQEIEIGSVKTELVSKGQEGARIVIERLTP